MKFYLTVFAMIAAAMLSAASSGVVFGDVSVTVKMQSAPAPEFKVKGGIFGKTPAPTNRDWAVIIVNFRPGVGVPGRDVKAAPGEWLDDVVLDVTVELPFDNGNSRKKQNTGLFTGQTKFWTIPLDGKMHTAVMFIPGRLLDRYLPWRGNGETKATETMFRVQAVFRDADAAVLGSGYFNVDGRDDRARNAVFARLADLPTVAGAVLPRNKSPWTLQNPDAYDLLKE